MRSAIPLLIGATLGIAVSAFPTGAGSCASGVDAVQSVHLTRTNVTKGSLEEGGFSVALGEATLVAGTTSSFTIGTDYNLKITGTKTFRGFLMRLDETETTTIDALAGGGSDIQVSDLCTGSGVGGVTHTSASDKSSVTATLKLDDAAAEMPLDVIVVVSNSEAGSEFYHTRFLLTAGSELTQAPVTSETTAPNSSTTLAPATPPPVSETTAPNTSATLAPATPPPVSETTAPNSSTTLAPATLPPVSETTAPNTSATLAPATSPPVSETTAPNTSTLAPTTQEPVGKTKSPVTSDAPATSPPLSKTPAPVPPVSKKTPAPVSKKTPAPVTPDTPATPAPVSKKTPAPVPPVSKTPAPAVSKKTPAPVTTDASTTPAPVPRTLAPVPRTPTPALVVPTGTPTTSGKMDGMGKKGMAKGKKGAVPRTPAPVVVVPTQALTSAPMSTAVPDTGGNSGGMGMKGMDKRKKKVREVKRKGNKNRSRGIHVSTLSPSTSS